MTELLDQYGYAVLFVSVLLMNAGIPVPGHTVYVAAAVMCGRGLLDLPVVMLVGAGAAVIGATAGFYIGRGGGRPLAERHGPRVGLTAARLEALERFFARYGAWALLLLRFVVVIRIFGALFAGISGVAPARFLVLTVAGAALWAAVFGFAGALLGDRFETLDEWIVWIGAGVALIALVAGVVHLIRRRRRRPGATDAR